MTSTSSTRKGNFKKDQRGNAILLNLPLLFIIVGAVQLSLNRSMDFTNSVKSFRAVGARDAILSNINMYSTLGVTFRTSLNSTLPPGTNSELENCVFGNGISPCTAGVEMPVTLYAPIPSLSAAGLMSYDIISGSSVGSNSKPALYDLDGGLCKTASNGVASPNCPFEVTSSFTATCAGGAASCASAETLTVRYKVRTLDTSKWLPVGALKALIDEQAASINVSEILPGAYDSSKNVMVTMLDGSSPTQITSTTDPDEMKALIKSALQSVGVSDTILLNNMVEAFYTTGWNIDFIKAIASVDKDMRDPVGLIISLYETQITDLPTAIFLIQCDIPDPDWMKIVAASGITNAYYGNEMYNSYDPDDPIAPALLKAEVDAVGGLPENVISVAIAASGVTNSATASSIYSKVSFISDEEVAAAMVDAGWYTDTTKMNSVLTAVEGLPSETANALVRLGVTNVSLAQALNSIVAPVYDYSPWGAAGAIIDGGGNKTLTQQLVDSFVFSSTSTTVATTTTSGSSGSTTTSSTSTTTTTTSSNQTTTTMLPTCTDASCSGATF